MVGTLCAVHCLGLSALSESAVVQKVDVVSDDGFISTLYSLMTLEGNRTVWRMAPHSVRLGDFTIFASPMRSAISWRSAVGSVRIGKR